MTTIVREICPEPFCIEFFSLLKCKDNDDPKGVFDLLINTIHNADCDFLVSPVKTIIEIVKWTRNDYFHSFVTLFRKDDGGLFIEFHRVYGDSANFYRFFRKIQRSLYEKDVIADPPPADSPLLNFTKDGEISQKSILTSLEFGITMAKGSCIESVIAGMAIILFALEHDETKNYKKVENELLLLVKENLENNNNFNSKALRQTSAFAILSYLDCPQDLKDIIKTMKFLKLKEQEAGRLAKKILTK